MFDPLLASGAVSSTRTRPTAIALILHIGIIFGAVRMTATTQKVPAPIARDTIRLQLSPVTDRERAGGELAAPSDPEPAPAPRRSEIEVPPLDLSSIPRMEIAFRMPASSAIRPTDASRDSNFRAATPRAGGPVVATMELDELPVLEGDFEPHYPALLSREGIGGLVVVEYVILANGRVAPSSLRVLGATHLAFSVAATEALMRARFRPGRRSGRPVAVLVRQTISFQNR